MVHFETLKRIFAEKPHTIEYFRCSYIIYTVIIIFVSGFVISSLEEARKDKTCDQWTEIPAPNIGNGPTTPYYACTSLVSGSKEVTKVNGAAAFLALMLFIIYFYYQVSSLELLRKVIPYLFGVDPSHTGSAADTSHVHASIGESHASTEITSADTTGPPSPIAPTTVVTPHYYHGAHIATIPTAMRTYYVCKYAIVICVELVGLWMIFNSTSNHEVIINSTAAFFLCELDAYVLDCIVQRYMLIKPVEGEYDVELANIDFSTSDLTQYFKDLAAKRLKEQQEKEEKEKNKANNGAAKPREPTNNNKKPVVAAVAPPLSVAAPSPASAATTTTKDVAPTSHQENPVASEV